MSIKAMKLALEALHHKKWFRIGSGKPNDPKVEAAITALNAAIEAAEKQDGWVLREVLFDDGEPIAHREPAQRQPLTDEQIELGRRVLSCFDLDLFMAGARFAEAAHGITGEKT